jgi:glyoxylase-like metal-dependent hydrolase (beta-lactamase superfamily II)
MPWSLLALPECNVARAILALQDQAALETSRQRILATADRVVPGHGEPFEAGRSS